MSDAAAPSPAPARAPLLDVARGVALVGMGVYHLVWDLGFFGLIPRDWPYDPRFVFFGHVVAASFLAMVGVSLALAARDGLNLASFWRRLGRVVGAALLVSAATYWAFPDSFIFFGVLHCIAAASVLALLFLRAPWPLTLLAGAAIIALPLWGGSLYLESIQWWSGLGVIEPRSNDWRPMFPWSGFTLLGLGATRAAQAWRAGGGLARWRGEGRVARTLALGGRHSLLIYLVHQPILLAFVFVAAQLVQARPVTGDEGLFVRTCTPQCVASGGVRGWCEKVCGCVLDGAKRESLWPRVAHGDLDEDGRRRYGLVTQQCVREASGK